MTLSPHKTGWRCQVYKNGIRKSKVFASKTEARAWGQRTETERTALRYDKRYEDRVL